MTYRLEVDLLGSQVHFGNEREEIGTATFRKWGGGSGTFTVDAPADLAMELMKAEDRKFAIFVEPITTSPADGAWTFRLLSAAALPTLIDPKWTAVASNANGT